MIHKILASLLCENIKYNIKTQYGLSRSKIKNCKPEC